MQTIKIYIFSIFIKFNKFSNIYFSPNSYFLLFISFFIFGDFLMSIIHKIFNFIPDILPFPFPPKVSTFLKDGKITPDEFVRAGYLFFQFFFFIKFCF
jgi:hypothetical protein